MRGFLDILCHSIKLDHRYISNACDLLPPVWVCIPVYVDISLDEQNKIINNDKFYGCKTFVIYAGELTSLHLVGTDSNFIIVAFVFAPLFHVIAAPFFHVIAAVLFCLTFSHLLMCYSILPA